MDQNQSHAREARSCADERRRTSGWPPRSTLTTSGLLRIYAVTYSEFEVIEQVMDEPLGRDVQLLQSISPCSDPAALFRLLDGMWRSGKISFVDSNGRALADWEVAAFVRQGTSCDKTRVIATEVGLDYAFGPRDESG